MKTNKHQTLLLVMKKEAVQAKDMVHQFDYSPATARSYLSYLTRQDLLKRTALGHALTEKGENRLHFFEVTGCGHPDCPRCEGKAGYYTCPRCGWKLPKKEARILKEVNTRFFRLRSGVFCTPCRKQIFTAEQARLLGIAEEEA